MDLSHLHLHVRDRARSVSFYRRWFGLRISSDGDDITFMKGDRDFLFALMAGGQIGGLIGVVLSVPTVAVLHILWLDRSSRENAAAA